MGRAEFRPSALRAQFGNGIQPFRGQQWQQRGRGFGIGGVFRSLVRMLTPMVSKGAKAIGKQALKSGVAATADIIEGKNVAQTLKEHGRKGASKLVKKAGRQVNKGKKGRKQKGSGVGRRGRKPRKLVGINKPKIGRRNPRTKKTDILGTYIAP